VTIQKDKRTGIVYRKWASPAPKAIFLLVHGLGAHSERWEFLSGYFLKNNISSYAIELKGFGETEGLRGHIDSFKSYFKDIESLRDIVGKENPGKKIFLLGESMGGLISFVLSAVKPALFDGLICISPAFRGRLKLGVLGYIKIISLLIYNSRKHLNIPFSSDMCTRDTDYRKAMEGDKREHRFATANLLFEMMLAQIKSNILKRRIKMPILFLLSGEDKMVDPGTSKKIFEGIGIKDKTLIEYPGMYHALSIDIGRERVFGDMLKWLQERI